MNSSSPSTKKIIISKESCLIEELKCPECKTSEIITDYREGNNICTNCGLILGGQLISEESEWRTFSDDGAGKKDDGNRVGGPENPLYNLSLGTMIGNSTSSGDNSSSALSKYQNASLMNNQYKVLTTGFRMISQLGNRLALSASIIENAHELYKKLEESKQFTKKKKEIVYLTCIFIACQQQGVPRNLKELVNSTDHLKPKDVTNLVKAMKKLNMLKKKKKVPNKEDINVSLERYCSSLKLPYTLVKKVDQLVNKIKSLQLNDGRSPNTINGVALYMITQCNPSYERSLKEIASVLYLNPITLKEYYKKLWNKRYELFMDQPDLKNSLDQYLKCPDSKIKKSQKK